MLDSEEPDESFVVEASDAEFAAAESSGDATVGTLDEPGMALKPWEPVVFVALGLDAVAVGFSAELDSVGTELSDKDVWVGVGLVGVCGVPVTPERSPSEVVIV